MVLSIELIPGSAVNRRRRAVIYAAAVAIIGGNGNGATYSGHRNPSRCSNVSPHTPHAVVWCCAATNQQGCYSGSILLVGAGGQNMAKRHHIHRRKIAI
ncbi:hypothetical protein [Mesorhizobium sp. 113-3-3]|uniref:hypothetical protein n=1 Tax=Mesorhizobium sp. 113-3-3 TaxID=2744516 RepID=UPI001926CE61|nr:hypothetical protein [Mesorhizobium sp. 113-3-3]